MSRQARGVFEKIPGSAEWWVRYSDASGKLRREKAGTKAVAIKLYGKRKHEALERRKLPENLRTRGITFQRLCDDALEYCKASNTAKSSYELELKINELLPVFGDREAQTITKQEIVRWLAQETAKRNWKPSSRNRWQAAFSLIFRVGVDNEKISNNPAARIRRKTENNGRVRFLSDDEYNKLAKAIDECGQRFRSAFDLSLNTGMRASEQFSLKWGQVDFECKLLTLPKTKNGKPRHIRLNPAAIRALESLKPESGASSGVTFGKLPVFPNFDGEAVQGPRGWFKSAVDRAGIADCTWHCNRHTFASRLVMAGVDLRTVGELLGHKSLQMTLRYSHLAPSHTQAAVERLVYATDTTTDTRQYAQA